MRERAEQAGRDIISPYIREGSGLKQEQCDPYLRER